MKWWKVVIVSRSFGERLTLVDLKLKLREDGRFISADRKRSRGLNAICGIDGWARNKFVIDGSLGRN